MHELSQEPMTCVWKYSHSDLFISYTCNPKYEGIQNELLEEKLYVHRRNLISMIFRLKAMNIMHLLAKGMIFRPVPCHMSSLAWQKRGLSHAQVWVWLAENVYRNQTARSKRRQKTSNVTNGENTQGGTINRNSPCMSSCVSINIPEAFCKWHRLVKMLIHLK